MAISLDTIIFQGELFVHGWFSNWKYRYCTLTTARHLNFYYHSDEINTKPIAYIDLSTVISINDTSTTLIPSEQQRSASFSPRSPSSTKSSKEFPMIHRTKTILYKSESDYKSTYIFCIETTSSDRFIFRCDNDSIMDQWMHLLRVYVFGDTFHEGFMMKRGHNFKTWKRRWFTLSSQWRELRYYKNKTISNVTYKGKIDLSLVNMMRFGDKIKYGYQYTIELILPNRTYVFVNTYHDIRQKWMNKLEYVLKGRNYCSLCKKRSNIDFNKRKTYYKMNVIHDGYLNLFTGNMDDPWKRSWYSIDGKTMRLFYTETISKMDEFESCVIVKECYEKYIAEHMDGYYLLFGEEIQIVDADTGLIGKEKKYVKMFNKLKYKFSIGSDVFGVNNYDELKKWIDALNDAVDLSKRDIDLYEDERNYLCNNHLNVLISQFVCSGLKESIKKCIVDFIGDDCSDNPFLITF